MTVKLVYQIKEIYSLPRQRQECDGLLIGTDGICYFSVNGENLQLGIGSIIKIPCGTEFSIRSSVGFSGIFIHTDSECGMKSLYPLMDYTGNIVPLAEMLHKAFARRENGGMLLSSLLDCILGCVNIISESNGESALVRMLKAKIADGYHSAEFDLASECLRLGYNHDYVRRVFRNSIGKTPSDFLTETRIESAKKILTLSPTLPISEVAAATGFSDQYYFSRVFSKVCGISPARYRKATKNEENAEGDMG